MICELLTECTGNIKTSGSFKCKNLKECVVCSDHRTKVKCEEKRKKYILENTQKNNVIVHKMDGGIITEDKTTQGINRCDYLFSVFGQESNALLIELKGVDISKGLKQISDTLDMFRDYFKQFDHTYGRLVMTSAYPKFNARPEYVKLVNKLRKEYKGNLKTSENEMQEKDVNLAMD